MSNVCNDNKNIDYLFDGLNNFVLSNNDITDIDYINNINNNIHDDNSDTNDNNLMLHFKRFNFKFESQDAKINTNKRLQLCTVNEVVRSLMANEQYTLTAEQQNILNYFDLDLIIFGDICDPFTKYMFELITDKQKLKSDIIEYYGNMTHNITNNTIINFVYYICSHMLHSSLDTNAPIKITEYMINLYLIHKLNI